MKIPNAQQKEAMPTWRVCQPASGVGREARAAIIRLWANPVKSRLVLW
jgi:hypothetical protein